MELLKKLQNRASFFMSTFRRFSFLINFNIIFLLKEEKYESRINCPNEKRLKIDKELEIDINKFLEIINNYLKDDTN